MDTWAPRCDKFLIIKNGSHLEEHGDTLILPVAQESRDELWHKVVMTFKHLYENYLNHYDWFMKADDDTYVLVDSLKRFLAKHDHREPIYFGHKFAPFVGQGYMSGGSGYVLSQEALRRLVEQGLSKKLEHCHLKEGTVEDVVMGECLEAVRVKAGDTRDTRERETFLPLSPQAYFNPVHRISWLPSYSYYHSKQNSKSISDQPIAFHYMSPREMRYTDYLLNRVAPSLASRG